MTRGPHRDVIGSGRDAQAVVGSGIDVEELLNRLLHPGLLQPLLSQSVFFLLDLATGIFWAVFVFVVSFYLMRDWHRVTATPRRARLRSGTTPASPRRAEAHRQAFFRGQVVLSSVIATTVAIAMAVVGPECPGAGIAGRPTGGGAQRGAVVAAIPAVALALLQGSRDPSAATMVRALVVGIYVVIQQVENNYLVPRIIGERSAASLVVLVGAIAGARMAGIRGIFLAPVLASARVAGLHYASS